MIYHTETDLHTLLDSLANGEYTKSTWVYDEYTITVNGPTYVDGRSVRCDRYFRWDDGSLTSSLTSLEVTRDEEVTVTRDDEEALKALLDSLENGDTVTAEWHNIGGSMSITGTVGASKPLLEVIGYACGTLRWRDGTLHSALRSITVRRREVQRWEREGKER